MFICPIFNYVKALICFMIRSRRTFQFTLLFLNKLYHMCIYAHTIPFNDNMNEIPFYIIILYSGIHTNILKRIRMSFK